MLGGDDPLWMLAAFEAITAFSAVMLGMLALGKFKQGPAITAGFAALTILVGALLGSISANNAIGDYQLRPHVIARVALAGLVGIGTLMLAIRSVRALIRFVIGGALVAPVLAALGLFLLGRLGGIFAKFDGLHPAVSLVVAILAGFAALAAVSAGGHLVIAAFEPGTGRPKPADANAE